jgi:streptogramin lyase
VGRVLRPSLLALRAPRAAPATFVVLLLVVLLVGGCALPPVPQPTATPPLITYGRFFIPSPESLPTGITAGPDGAVWFSELSGGFHIGRISASHVLTEFPASIGAQGITAGPDGAVWFTSFSEIGRITPAGTVTEFPLPSATHGTDGITAGPDGALWFTEIEIPPLPAGGSASVGAIGRVTPSGKVTEFPLPTPNAGPQGITTGPDGALWFTEATGDQIGRISLAGTVTEFPIPTARSYPQTITAGPDGALWFTERQANKIGRITLAGTITEFPIPEGGRPWGITAGPDGALWFTEDAGTVLGRLTVSGVFAHLPLPPASTGGEHPIKPVAPRGITVGPDGALWFAEAGSNLIVRVGLVRPSAIPTSTAAVVPADPPVGSAAGPATAWRESERTLTVHRRARPSSVWL